MQPLPALSDSGRGGARYVQGESLKARAVACQRLSNSPIRTGEFRLLATLKRTLPPGFVWMRVAMRLCAAGIVSLLGLPQIAVVLAVMAFMPVVAFAEVQIARALDARVRRQQR